MTRIPKQAISRLLFQRIAVLVLAMVTALFVGQFTEAITISFIKSVRNWVQPQPKLVLSADGVPYVDYQTVSGVDIGVYKSPVQVASALTKATREYRKGNPEALERVKTLANWILEDLTQRNDYSIFEYSISWPKYDLTPPWFSALAQGLAVEALAEAYDVTKDPRFLEAARRVLRSFYVAVEDGGVTHKDAGGWWFEEYAKPGNVKPYVLNGMIYALLSIHRYSELIPDKEAFELFKLGLHGLKSRLHEFDFGGFSKYDLVGSTAGHYHVQHVRQMRDLYALTNDPDFLLLADRWDRHEERWYVEKLVRSPTKMTLAAFLLNAAFFFVLFEILLLFRYLQMRRAAEKVIEKRERVAA